VSDNRAIVRCLSLTAIHSGPPPSLPSVPILELNCFVHGDDPHHVFPIKIARTDTVGTLKEAIKDKNPESFHDVDARSLHLWKVSIPDDHHLKDKLEKLALREEEVLSSVARLSTLFSDKLEDERIHIVVSMGTGELGLSLHVPSLIVSHIGSHPNLSSKPHAGHRDLELNCVIFGDHHDAGKVFSVEIPNTKPISALKDAIKDKQQFALRDVDANALRLWKISVPVHDDFTENVQQLDLKDKDSLSSVDRLSSCFSDNLVDGHVHIIVLASPSCGCN
jgi:hypothetical protein